MYLLADNEPILFIVGGVVAVVAILVGSLTSILNTRARENSRREIAAYIAEGSMTAEQGERLMRAAPDESDE